jgi:hypothetical protein
MSAGTIVGGWLFNKHLKVRVPKDVVQWRIEANPACLVTIHLARGDGTFEIRNVHEQEEVFIRGMPSMRWYEPGDLMHFEHAEGDKVCVFIEKEWDD